ncbi:hypothetical protein V9K67_21715 [Paraflavisolibacter sp. H34]|uniref:hypothetical protein n=1 Tax=Huijunlia imazamoxiresistens TaxID=3127457 RepID=UPI0030177B66
MKVFFIFLPALLFASCKPAVKPVEFKKVSSSNPDGFYANHSARKLEGKVKPGQFEGKACLSYQLTFAFDTSANKLLDPALFRGEPVFYGQYSEDVDVLSQQLYQEAKQRVDSLQAVVNSQNPYGQGQRQEGRSRRSLRNGTAEELLLELYKGSLNSPLEFKKETGEILQKIREAKRLTTYPYLYENPHFPTRQPALNVCFVLKFYDSDGFELASYQTGRYQVWPLKENFVEGKIETGYKSLDDFNGNIYSKVKRIVVNVVASTEPNR